MVWSVIKISLKWVYESSCIRYKTIDECICPQPATQCSQEKRIFCQCLQSLKTPQGYSSNIKSLVYVNDLKLFGLKSHDYHVLMQQLLPVSIRGILTDKVRVTITRLCHIFNAICSKVIDPWQLDDLENEATIALCQIEMYFPPSFFDIMVHLIVHLVKEIRLCGPIFFTMDVSSWMEHEGLKGL